jgi:hypothetical protein
MHDAVVLVGVVVIVGGVCRPTPCMLAGSRAVLPTTCRSIRDSALKFPQANGAVSLLLMRMDGAK